MDDRNRARIIKQTRRAILDALKQVYDLPLTFESLCEVLLVELGRVGRIRPGPGVMPGKRRLKAPRNSHCARRTAKTRQRPAPTTA